ncbi:MAG: hypothetical protein C3F17_12955 [Bradyrhizobiaceae bacterium]|nr:MAG: hypothetical protein C3F17_12955 [Bradyrhizobiaceae bacterium]
MMRGWKLFGWVLTFIAFLGAAFNVAGFVVLHAVVSDLGQDLTASLGHMGADLLAAVEVDARLVFLALLTVFAAATVKLAIGTVILVKRSRRWR